MAKPTTPSKTAVSKKPRASKKADPVISAMSAELTPSGDLSAEDAALAALINGLDEQPQGELQLANPGGDEVQLDARSEQTQEAGTGDVRAAEICDTTLNAALANVEAAEISAAHGTPSTGEMTAESVLQAAAEGAGGDAAPADAAGEKKVPVPRKHYTNKADRIIDRLGDKLQEYTVLTVDDAAGAIDEAALKAKMEETMAVIRGMNKKCQNRASLLMDFVAGKKAQLNEVMARALRVLHTDGQLTTGKEGNLLKNLLARPYSEAAARAMGGNSISVFEDLKLIKADGKGKYLPNPDSLLLAKANSLLGLGTVSS